MQPLTLKKCKMTGSMPAHRQRKSFSPFLSHSVVADTSEKNTHYSCNGHCGKKWRKYFIVYYQVKIQCVPFWGAPHFWDTGDFRLEGTEFASFLTKASVRRWVNSCPLASFNALNSLIFILKCKFLSRTLSLQQEPSADLSANGNYKLSSECGSFVCLPLCFQWPRNLVRASFLDMNNYFMGTKWLQREP